jgi:hypothetical protein
MSTLTTTTGAAEIAVRKTDSQAITAISFSDEQRKVLMDSVFAGLSEPQAAYAFNVCKQRNLNPFAGQVAMWQQGGKVQVCVTIAGMLALAEATGEYEGMDAIEFCGQDGVWSDVWLHDGVPTAAKCTMYRKGRKPMVCVARFVERCDSSKLTHRNAPCHTLGNAVIRDCLRRLFPSEIGGLYDRSEMESYATGHEVQGTYAEVTNIQPAPQPQPALATEEQKAQIMALVKHLPENHEGVRKVVANIDTMYAARVDAGLHYLQEQIDMHHAALEDEAEAAEVETPAAKTKAKKATKTEPAAPAVEDIDFSDNPY